MSAPVRRIKQLKKDLQDHDNAAEDDDFTEQVYDDPQWTRSAWGPWGPGYGCGPGLGW